MVVKNRMGATEIIWPRQKPAASVAATVRPRALDNLVLPARSPLPPASDVSCFANTPVKGDSLKVFQTFLKEQFEKVPALKAVYDDIGVALRASQPSTVQELLASARGLAFFRLNAAGLLAKAGPAKDHVITAAALAALSGHSLLRQADSPYERFPKYIDDGRKNSQPDKAWHLINQSLFSYMVLFDERFGKGEVAKGFIDCARSVDKNDSAGPIGAAYDRLEGKMVGMLPGTIAPLWEPDAPYFARPLNLDANEALAYDEAVRVGDYYEAYSTGLFPKWLGYDEKTIGSRPELEDPTSRAEYTLANHSGLSDISVMRDLTADRVGAWLGVQLFRNPGQLPQIPFDLGANWTNRPLAAGPKGPFEAFYAAESTLIAKLAGTSSAEADSGLDGHFAWAEEVGHATAVQELKRKIVEQVDRLDVNERSKLAAYYGNFSVRQLIHQVSFGEGPAEAPDFETHRDWALSCSVDSLKEEFLRRVDLVSAAYRIRDLGEQMRNRVLASPGIGTLEGEPVPFLNGALQNLHDERYQNQTARLVSDETGAHCHVVMNGFLSMYESKEEPQFHGRYGYDVLGLPQTDEVPFADGVMQRFECGYMTWSSSQGVRVFID